jgi:hypothetical protein
MTGLKKYVAEQDQWSSQHPARLFAAERTAPSDEGFPLNEAAAG